MSTKIYNGIKFKVDDIYDLYEKLNHFKEKSIVLYREMLNERYPRYLENIMKKNYKENGIFKNLWDISDELIYELKKSRMILLKNKIQIYPHIKTKELYGYYVLDFESEKLLNKQDWVLDYHYQNQTDSPDNISYDEFSKRGDMWDELFDDSYNINDTGFEYKIYDISENLFPMDVHFRKTYKELSESIPRLLKLERIVDKDENEKI